jgi:hypothetical protein
VTAPQLVLILDKCEAHELDDIYELADALNIFLIFIPRGGTGDYQPRDRRVFGALKAKGRPRWSTFFAENPGSVCTREHAAGLLLECWAELQESCIQAGWDLDAEGENQMPSNGDDDGEWELTMEQCPGDRDETSDGDEEELDPTTFSSSRTMKRAPIWCQLTKSCSRSLFAPILFRDPFFEGQGTRSRIFIQSENPEKETEKKCNQMIFCDSKQPKQTFTVLRRYSFKLTIRKRRQNKM